MSSEPFVRTANSTTELIEPEGDEPRAKETTLAQDPFESEILLRQLPRLKYFSTLSPPYQRVLRVSTSGSRFDPDIVETVMEPFHGVTLDVMVDNLSAEGKVLPLDVWLAVVEHLADAAQMRESCEYRTPFGLDQLGLSVTGELVVAPSGRLNVFHNSGLRRIHVTTREENTRRYALFSPEGARGEPLDERSTVFSLSTIFIHALTGEFARGGDRAIFEAIVRGPFAWSRRANPGCTVELADVIDHAHAREPYDRFQSIRELLEAVRSSARTAPAPLERVRAVLTGACAAELTTLFEFLSYEPTLPQSWKQGGLDVMQDRLLQQLISPS